MEVAGRMEDMGGDEDDDVRVAGTQLEITSARVWELMRANATKARCCDPHLYVVALQVVIIGHVVSRHPRRDLRVALPAVEGDLVAAHVHICIREHSHHLQ